MTRWKWRISRPLSALRRQPEHALAARVMGRHQAVDVARKLRAAALPWRLELRRDVGPLLAPERHQAAAEAHLLALIARHGGHEIIGVSQQRIGERSGVG